ncbi:MAG: VTT domain-containing protein [Clostridiales bacterium]|nr:VTT domain-containing protein [Clostridiales bacterium]
MKLKRKPEAKDWLNIALIILFITAVVWLGKEYAVTFGAVSGGDLAASAEHLRQLLLSYGDIGVLVLILLHILHIVICIIPAVIVQFGGGVVYGMIIGMLAGYAGIFIGTVISFYLSRFLGRRIITLFISANSIDKLDSMISGSTTAIALFLLFLIPFPKDMISYFIGLSKMKFGKFIVINLLGRTPGMLIATYLGAHIFGKNYALIALLIVICLLLCIITYLYRGKIIAFASKSSKR